MSQKSKGMAITSRRAQLARAINAGLTIGEPVIGDIGGDHLAPGIAQHAHDHLGNVLDAQQRLDRDR